MVGAGQPSVPFVLKALFLIVMDDEEINIGGLRICTPRQVEK